MKLLKYYSDYFDKIKYKDDFGYKKTWNKEINKWLELKLYFDNLKKINYLYRTFPIKKPYFTDFLI